MVCGDGRNSDVADGRCVGEMVTLQKRVECRFLRVGKEHLRVDQCVLVGGFSFIWLCVLLLTLLLCCAWCMWSRSLIEPWKGCLTIHACQAACWIMSVDYRGIVNLERTGFWVYSALVLVFVVCLSESEMKMSLMQRTWTKNVEHVPLE